MIHLVRQRLMQWITPVPVGPRDPYDRHAPRVVGRAAVLALLAVAALAQTLLGEMLWRDDTVIAARAVAGWRDAAVRGGMPTVFATESVFFGGDSAAWRAASAGLHALNVVLLWMILRRLGVSVAWLAAAVWAVHPAAMNGAAWVARHGELVTTALALGTTLAWLRWCDCRPLEPRETETTEELQDDRPARIAWRDAAVVFSVTIAVIAVAPAAALATAIFTCIATGTGRHARGRGVKAARWAFVGVAVIVFGVVMSVQANNADAGRGMMSIRERWGVFCHVTATLPTWVAWPTARPIAVDRATITAPVLYDWLAVATWCAIALALWFINRRVAAAGVAAGLLLIAANSFTATLPDGAVTSAELRPYAAAMTMVVAFTAAAAWAAGRIVRGAEKHVVAPAAVTASLVAGLLWLTSIQADALTSNEVAWRTATELDPKSKIARAELARVYVVQGKLDLAAAALACVEGPADPQLLLARGRIAVAAGDLAAARASFAEAYAAAPDSTDATVAHAEALADAGDVPAALAVYTTAAARRPNDPALANNAGLLLRRAGDVTAAELRFRAALAVDPRYTAARLNLANLLFDTGKLSEAAAELQTATENDPRNPAAYAASGLMLLRLNDPARAEKMLRVAARLDPTSAEAFQLLSAAQTAQGHDKDAAWSAKQAARLRVLPSNVDE